MNGALTVTQLNTYVRSVLEQDGNLADIFLVGEISNFTNHYRTGHFYMSLKDESSLIKAVMFRTNAQRLKFMPENGMSVLCRGRASLFERDGQYQFYIDDMQPFGEGALNIAFEQLKDRLQKEGLFDPDRKKQIPELPMNIAVVTSPTGAALQDILNIISRRFPICTVTLCPVQVQGDTAPSQMIKTLNILDKINEIDLVIIGRGGGSLEDLWAFNDENLARRIFSFSKPIISAVGHETDFTICDFVCDLRAPTPSAAAELAVPDIDQLYSFVSGSKALMIDSLKRIVEYKRQNLLLLSKSTFLKNPDYLIDTEKQKIELLKTRLKMNIEGIFSNKSKLFENASIKLYSFSPLAVLKRGYSIIEKDGKTVTSTKEIKSNDVVKIVLSDGEAEATIL